MGRPFENELAALADTYAWASTLDVTPLRESLVALPKPLLAVGSGGSFSAAAHAAALHERKAGALARAATPLDCANTAPSLGFFSALLVSAGGKNRDALQACSTLVEAEASALTILTAVASSPLAKLAKGHGATCVELDPPAGRDGFLATNSLFAFCTLLSRAYATDGELPLPPTAPALVGSTSLSAFEDVIVERLKRALDRETFLVLHGPTTRVAALDLESKFSEAALGSVHVSDFRNFGHGRHHWLAKRGKTTSVIAFVHGSDEPLAKRTLAPIPDRVPCARIDIPGDVDAAPLAGLLATFFITAAAGRSRGIDPGRPGVPEFGSRLYSVRMPAPGKRTRTEAAAHRKLRTTGSRGSSRWTEAAENALRTLEAETFASIAIDYDGTLCGPRSARFRGLEEPVATTLAALVNQGVLLGIATGRGKSVRDELQRALTRDLWPRVVVGYYNGGFIAPLSDEIPADVKEPASELDPLLKLLLNDKPLARIARIEGRRPQITIEPIAAASSTCIWSIVQRYLTGFPHLHAVSSSHSFDVLAPGVSKLAVVRELQGRRPGPTLRIGDRGAFPGNDFALLDSPHGLSVEDVSPFENGCWNFLPPGVRGVRGALDYLTALRVAPSGFRIALREVTE